VTMQAGGASKVVSERMGNPPGRSVAVE
jgi:hypothetical protein